MKANPIFLIDYYKASHYKQQKDLGAISIFSTWTARSDKYHPGCPNTVVFGHQAFIQEYFIDLWNNNFFSRDVDDLHREFTVMMSSTLDPAYCDFTRFADLHKLGYLPIEVWSIPEGTLIPIRVPQCTMFNTHPDFAWLPQYLEDMWSCHNWLPSTSATTSYYRRKDLEPYFEATCDDPTAIRRICGDFSLRGMTGEQAAYASGLGHLLSFDRTATVGTNEYAEEYYGADILNNPVGFGTPSLEHSVVCQGIAKYSALFITGNLPSNLQKIANCATPDMEISLVGEMLFLYTLLTEIQPTGVLSYVSDTNDYWGILTKVLPILKPFIQERKGKLVIRPDSGNPYKIVCGDSEAKPIHERLGSLACLELTFGSTTNSKGFRVLPPYIGLIYGDAITRDTAIAILGKMQALGFAANNISLGIGAYTFQYVTRDTRGFAIKATNVIFQDGLEVPLSKNPKTDDGTKKSLSGAVRVNESATGEIWVEDNLSLNTATSYQDGNESFPANLLRPIFRDGKALNIENIYTIRDRLWKGGF